MIDATQAIEIARSHATAKGWAFAEPLQVTERRSWRGAIARFEIETNAGRRGSKARFVVDADTGAVVSAGYVPR